MTKYLETAKIKKYSETIGLHPYIGNRSVNMITRGQLRPRGSHNALYIYIYVYEPEEPRHNQGSDYKYTRKRPWEMTSFNPRWRT
eukprot:4135813-Amphidinium_carterae.1